MSNNVKEGILLVGLGYMGKEYHKVLQAMGIDYTAVGRSEAGCRAFSEATGHSAFAGGLDRYIEENGMPYNKAILAVQAEYGSECAVKLINGGIKELLVEKPCGLDNAQADAIIQAAESHGAKVVIAYNRRFYAATLAAEQIIKEDGGVVSMKFDFTEKGFRDEESIDGLLIGNSTHVMDLAFWLAGEPAELLALNNIEKKGSSLRVEFAGAGRTVKEALFSYSANWKAPGRWSVEVMTPKHRLIFSPMEKLQIQDTGSFAVREEKIDDALDVRFKPGIYKEVEMFLGNIDNERLLTIQKQRKHFEYYFAIAHGREWKREGE